MSLRRVRMAAKMSEEHAGKWHSKLLESSKAYIISVRAKYSCRIL